MQTASGRNLKKYLLVMAGLSVLAYLVFIRNEGQDITITARDSGPPRLMVDPLEFSFPEPVEDDASLRSSELENEEANFATFEISNGGGGVLHVDIEGYCGCISLSSKTLQLLPDETRILRVEVRPPEVGTKRIRVALRTNDPMKQAEDLAIVAHGRQRPPFVLESVNSRRISFLNVVRPGMVQKVVFQTVEDGSSTPWVNEAVCSAQYLSITPSSLDEEPYGGSEGFVKRRYAYDLTVSGMPPSGDSEGIVSFRNSSGKSEIITFSSLVNCVKPYYAVPGAILFDRSSDYMTVEKELFVFSAETRKPVAMEEVTL